MNRSCGGVVRILLIIVLATLAPTAGVLCGTRGEQRESSLRQPEPRGEAGATEAPTDKRRVHLFPVDDLFVDGMAGPHRRGMGVVYTRLSETDLADVGDRLFGLVLGGRFGLLRVRSVDRPDRSWQFGIEAGFYGQFDIDQSYDNVGWDGFYGAALTAALGRGWAAKVGVLHTSSHVGDEYAERTGRRRIGYTREELVIGISRSLRRRWRVLAEAGWGYDLRNEELQAAGRLQCGVEYLAPRRLWGGRAGWYTAVAGSAVAERDWQLDWAIDAGLLLSPLPRRWRLGFQYYRGRAPIGEFFLGDQSMLSIGLWLDL